MPLRRTAEFRLMKTHRKMNFGFNTNVRVGAATFHVQTEDRGLSHPFLDTVVYSAGRVVHKLSTSYKGLLDYDQGREASVEMMHHLLHRQHRSVIAQLEAGKLELKIPEDDSRAALPAIEVRLLNPRSWLSAGRATLELEAVERVSGKPLSAAEFEVSFEGTAGGVAPMSAQADERGRAVPHFLMPKLSGEGAALVVRASSGELRGELRFQLKSKRREPAAEPPAK